MSGARPLLRLEDKVAAEGRRLRTLGGPPMRWVGPAVLVVAAALHGAILLLPTVRVRAALPVRTPVPDLPLVWRPAPPPVSMPPASSGAQAATARPPVPQPDSIRAAVAGAAGPIATEPVPEPTPELVLNTMSTDVEAIVPDPDTPPPSPDLGPPSGAVPAVPQNAVPTLVEQVPPVYPVAARSLRAEGHVTLRLAVLPDGRVGGASVEECSRKGLGFEAAALDAVKRWRYAPAPTSAPRTVTVTVQFQRQEGRP